jgi:hypothetical protein
MTEQEALKEGFVYEGYYGVVPVYLTELNAFGYKNPGYAPKYGWMLPVMDVQDWLNEGLCWLINKVKPGAATGITIAFGRRLDGKYRTEKELD